ncbi:MAG: PSD1 domain-containing protein [Planctomycetaceae bacterium]|nr:PSD1 domain-containing protein [Planctomycetales bacterium]MCB9921472.1 PSD1 domain-containing protein [Planctomycetaceae bacterium]
MPRLSMFFFMSLVLLSHLASAAEEIDFARDIRPLLSDNCYHCHGPDEKTREADLRLDTKEGLFQNTGELAIVLPHEPQASELIRRIVTNDPDERMPPPDSQRTLTSQQIELLRRWVESGASWEGHWSFQPLLRPSVPTMKVVEAGTKDQGHEIDRFIRAKLLREGLEPSPRATKERLLRRVTLDLTGLPPTLVEIDSFLADDSEEAFEKVVDRLLASRHYGERMAWDWLDAARYADTNGYQGDRERTMWPWRDWVVKAFNENLPFDEFTVWQIAGDLLPDATFEQQLATGFCRNHMINGEGGRIAEENRIEYIFDQMETVGTVWMGLTLQCSRCHDHKFDPLTRREYYQFFAFFNRTPVTGGGGDPQTAPVIEAPTDEQRTQLAEASGEINTLGMEIDVEESSLFTRSTGDSDTASQQVEKLPEEVSKALKVQSASRNDSQLAAIAKHFEEQTPEYASRLTKLREVIGRRNRIQGSVARVMIMQDMEEPRKTFMLDKGLYNQPGEEVSANVQAIFPALPPDTPKNRLALARWLVNRSHPLTARVTVNRFWQMFFGTGLVKTTEDFGEQGERPTHPELLDWLATDFVDSGWDVKRLCKTIVTSETYQQTAHVAPQLLEADPDNRFLARGTRLRMPAWMIRDHALATSGLLVDKLGGPAVNPYQPPGVWAEATFGKKTYQQGHGEDLYRRSLYTFWRRIVGPTMFFDSAKRQTCSVKDSRTNTPLHALTTLNDVMYVEAARLLAQRAMTSSDQDVICIETAFRLATSRKPTAVESTVLLARLTDLKARYAAAPNQAQQLLAVGESPRDEQHDVIEHAAYTALCSLLLNLDEALTK